MSAALSGDYCGALNSGLDLLAPLLEGDVTADFCWDNHQLLVNAGYVAPIVCPRCAESLALRGITGSPTEVGPVNYDVYLCNSLATAEKLEYDLHLIVEEDQPKDRDAHVLDYCRRTLPLVTLGVNCPVCATAATILIASGELVLPSGSANSMVVSTVSIGMAFVAMCLFA